MTDGTVCPIPIDTEKPQLLCLDYFYYIVDKREAKTKNPFGILFAIRIWSLYQVECFGGRL